MTAPTQTALAEVALEFCRECLGWEDPHDYGDAIRTFDKTTHPAYVTHDLRYRDLNAVIKAVRGWCDTHDGSISLSYASTSKVYFAICHCGTRETVDSRQQNPCHALLSACVEAQRKLREAV